MFWRTKIVSILISIRKLIFLNRTTAPIKMQNKSWWMVWTWLSEYHFFTSRNDRNNLVSEDINEKKNLLKKNYREKLVFELGFLSSPLASIVNVQKKIWFENNVYEGMKSFYSQKHIKGSVKIKRNNERMTQKLVGLLTMQIEIQNLKIRSPN